MLDKIAGLSSLQIEMLAAFLLLEGVIFAAIPEEIIILSIGVLWAEGRVGFAPSLIALFIGLLPANFAMVLMGHKLGSRIMSLPPFSWMIKPEHLKKAIDHVHRHARLTIFVTRFTPAIRGPVYLAVGVSRFSLLGFLIYDFLASLIHVPLLMAAGHFIGRRVPVDVVYKCLMSFSAVTIIVSVIFITIQIRNGLRNRKSKPATKALGVASNQ